MASKGEIWIESVIGTVRVRVEEPSVTVLVVTGIEGLGAPGTRVCVCEVVNTVRPYGQMSVYVVIITVVTASAVACDVAMGVETEVAVTGQIVVYDEIVSVVTLPMRAGQSVTVVAQDVIV